MRADGGHDGYTVDSSGPLRLLPGDRDATRAQPCGVPYPMSVHDVIPMHCERHRGHPGDHYGRPRGYASWFGWTP